MRAELGMMNGVLQKPSYMRAELAMMYGVLQKPSYVRAELATLQRQFHLYIPFLGIARPEPQFPHSCVFERFIYSQNQSTYFLQQNRQTHRWNI